MFRYRAITDADLPLLYDIYASTRVEELALVPHWSDEDKRNFLTQQFNAQHQYYQDIYRDADFNIIELEGKDIGRLYIQRKPDDIRIVDISILPAFRNKGFGAAILQEILAEAKLSGKKVSIHVEMNNPARRLYDRLGFKKVSETNEVYHLMEWTPSSY